MSCRTLRSHAVLLFGVVTALSTAVPARMDAQGARGAQQPSTPSVPKVTAPVDLTGFWVSIVTEDWRFRMITPDKGDFSSVPLNPEGRRVANTWDPEKDEADGNQCKSYGAAAIMRVPDTCMSSGKTMTHCGSIRTPETRLVFYTLKDQCQSKMFLQRFRAAKRRRGKVIPWLHGRAEAKESASGTRTSPRGTSQ